MSRVIFKVSLNIFHFLLQSKSCLKAACCFLERLDCIKNITNVLTFIALNKNILKYMY